MLLVAISWPEVPDGVVPTPIEVDCTVELNTPVAATNCPDVPDGDVPMPIDVDCNVELNTPVVARSCPDVPDGDVPMPIDVDCNVELNVAAPVVFSVELAANVVNDPAFAVIPAKVVEPTTLRVPPVVMLLAE